VQYSSQIDGRTIVVTGGTGSFGHQMINELSAYAPAKVIVFSRDEDKQHRMRSEYAETEIGRKISYVIGDVRDYDRVATAMKNADIIFHAAAMKQVPYVESHPYEAVKTNINGAYNVLKAAIANKVPNVIAISTDKAVKPVNAMGMTKALQEKIMLSDDLTKDELVACCVRYGNVMGSRGSVTPLFDDRINKKQPLPITHPKMTRFMLTLPQAVELVFYSLKHARGGEIFVKKAPAANMVEFAKSYAELLTGNSEYPLEYVGIRPGEKMHEILVSSEEMTRAKDRETHFVILRQEQSYDRETLKYDDALDEYSSSRVHQLTREELKSIMRGLQWTV
jgi:FlaA1/EpsC-like NDP-sugar epimerase